MSGSGHAHSDAGVAAAASRNVPLILGGYALYLLTIALLFWFKSASGVPLYLFRHQDFPVLLLDVGFLLIAAGIARTARVADIRLAVAPAVLIAAIFLLTAAGTRLLFADFAFSRDETLADFDADILRHGQLMARMPAAWSGYADALLPAFRHPIPGNVAWISNYLPGNAAWRALADATIGRSFASPVLATIAAVALFRAARRLWPSAPSAALLALTLLATAPQFLITAMTPYAMTAHLACNLLWLCCYLRDDRRGIAGALAVGFVATGLHQLLFHPLFVLPFILDLLAARRWRRAAIYCAGYAVIAGFWISYWPLAFAIGGISVPHTSGGAAGGIGGGIAQIAAVASGLLAAFSLSDIQPFMLNLLRLVAWQHVLLIPLALLAWPAIRRGAGIARPLAGGIVLTALVMLLLMSSQGYGWGYRYLHGYLGSLALLAVYGWRDIAATERARLRWTVIAATAVTILVILPLDMISAYRLVRPYRAAYAMIVQAGTPIVLLDPAHVITAEDLVRNRPDLRNRPLILDVKRLAPGQIAALCHRYPVALFGRREAAIAGIPVSGVDTSAGRKRALAALGCTVEQPAAWAAPPTLAP